MPAGNGPPDLGFPQDVFNRLRQLTYDATNQAFSDHGTLVYMYAERSPSGSYDQVRWFDGTATQGSGHPRGKIPAHTYTVIKNGTYVTATSSVAYNGQNYRFRLSVTTAGVQIAEAHTI